VRIRGTDLTNLMLRAYRETHAGSMTDHESGDDANPKTEGQAFFGLSAKLTHTPAG
jgi:hypothetical protein